jgi:hypothetical protein
VEISSEVGVSSLASTVLPLTILAKSSSYRTATISIVALALIIGLAAYFTGVRERVAAEASIEAPAKVAAKPEPAEPAEPTEPPVESVKVKVSIDVQPRSTTLTIDGKRLEENPYSALLTLSANTHQLVASAPGYQTIRRDIRLDRNLSLRFALAEEQPKEEIVVKPMEVETTEPTKKVQEGERREGVVKRQEKRVKALTSESARRSAKKVEAEEARSKDTGTGTVAVDNKATTDRDKKAPTPGDTLRRKRDQRTRKIDKDNPYN